MHHSNMNKRQTIGATNHFLHVSCHGSDPAAQSIVLGNNLRVLLHPEPWKRTQTLIYYTSAAVATVTECKYHWWDYTLKGDDTSKGENLKRCFTKSVFRFNTTFRSKHKVIRESCYISNVTV